MKGPARLAAVRRGEPERERGDAGESSCAKLSGRAERSLRVRGVRCPGGGARCSGGLGLRNWRGGGGP